jgi:hypothetical protein
MMHDEESRVEIRLARWTRRPTTARHDAVKKFLIRTIVGKHVRFKLGQLALILAAREAAQQINDLFSWPLVMY